MNLVRTRACPLDCGDGFAHVRAHAHDRDVDRFRAFARDLGAVFSCARILNRSPTRARNLNFVKGFVSNPECVLAFIEALGRSEKEELMEALSRSVHHACRRDPASTRRIETPPGHVVGHVRPLAASRRLTVLVLWMLPAADRPEYEVLFHSELVDLAQAGSGRCAQLAYALRVLVRAPLLRRELRAPARERSW